MFTKRFLFDALERAVKTFAQTLVGMFSTVAAMTSTAQWKASLISAAVAAGLSLLTSVASYQQRDSISPASLVPPEG